MEMKKIASFQVDHTKLDIGMYISRIDGGIVTYDVRMVKPNGGKYLSNPSLHTIEHLFATYARSAEQAEHVVYVGPMGCRTGFYFIARGISHMQAIELVRDSLQYVLDFEGEIPGATEVECGNYKEHDLTAAKADVADIVNKLQDYTPGQLVYNS